MTLESSGRAQVTASRYEGAVPEGVLQHIRSHVEEFGLHTQSAATRLTVRYGETEVAFSVDDGSFTVRIAAGSQVPLHQTRESVLYLLDHVFPEASAAMEWSGVDVSARVPPNFHLATVAGVRRLSANFLRIEMECDGIEALEKGGMHFSLLLPPPGRRPVWPMLTANGRTNWPSGEETLHRAAYTFVSLDAAAGWFTFDLYEHDGGRTTVWAQTVRPGEVVGIMGPGGGDFPPGDFLVIAGDETALPAIRRILETSPASRRGVAFIETADPADRCALERPEGMTAEWLQRGSDRGLWEALREVVLPEGEVFVWVAAEQALVRVARDHFRALGVPRTMGYFSAYWAR